MKKVAMSGVSEEGEYAQGLSVISTCLRYLKGDVRVFELDNRSGVTMADKRILWSL